MIPVPTSCRERLQPRDFEFIVAALAGRDKGGERFLTDLFSEPGSLNAILDHDRLLRAVLELPSPLTISPELYFYTIVRRSLKDAGIDDVEIADYVAATLAENAGSSLCPGSSGKMPDADFTYHVDIIEKMNEASPTERFFLEVQCGNRFLVLTGLFPRFLERRAERRGAPGLNYYEGVARNAFLLAGRHPLAEEFAVRDIYRRLGDCFSETRRALNRMADEMLFLGA